MVGSLLAASLVARHLGGGRTAQISSAAFVATIPMGVLQASGTQNDYVAAFWIIAMLAIALASASQPPSYRSWLIIAVGGAFGLAILTKPTAYLFGVPFAVFVSLWWVRTFGVRRAWPAIVAVGLVAGAVNTGHYFRSIAIYGSPFGPTADYGYAYGADTLRPASVASTVVRNLALHVATPSEWLNRSSPRL